MKQELYYGLTRIATRLGVGRHKVKEWGASGRIRLYQDGEHPSSPFFCIESELTEDIARLSDPCLLVKE